MYVERIIIKHLIMDFIIMFIVGYNWGLKTLKKKSHYKWQYLRN